MQDYQNILIHTKTNGSNKRRANSSSLMKCFINYGFNEFVIALGYKRELIKKYFEERKEDEISNCN